MTTDAAVLDAPPSAPLVNPNPVSFKDAVVANDHFMRTGKAPEKPAVTPPPADKKDVTPPPSEKKPGAPDPTKQDAPPAAKPDGRGGLESIKPKVEPEKKPPTDTPKDKDLTPEQKQQKAWEELKSFKEKYGELPTKYEQTEKQLKELLNEKTAWETDRKDLEAWKAERDMRDFTKSDAYKTEVATPFAQVEDSAWEIAVAAVAKEGMNEQEEASLAQPLAQRLMKALNNPNAILRERQVRAILEGATNDIPDGAVANLVSKGETLKALGAKYAEMEKNAKLKLSEHENMQKAEKLKADTEAREILEKSYESVSEILTVNAADVITPEMLANAREAFNKLEKDMKPLDTAFGNLSHGLVPELIQTVRSLKADLAAKEEELKAMESARPGIRPSSETPETKPGPTMSLGEAVRAHKEAGAQM